MRYCSKIIYLLPHVTLGLPIQFGIKHSYRSLIKSRNLLLFEICVIDFVDFKICHSIHIQLLNLHYDSLKDKENY